MIGSRLAHYEVTAHLGSGGMGDVYQATDSKLGRAVAIKMLPEEFAREPERVARFQREARVLASLNHASIAAIHGIEESDGRAFLVMELVPGETLEHRISGRALPVSEALQIALQIAGALEAAHEGGVVHRDLKPANIKVAANGSVKLLDFGIAKAASAALAGAVRATTIVGEGTAVGAVLGTPPYMSPEQARGQAIDRRTDIFAFGCVLYEMLAGCRAFEGATVTDTIAHVVATDPDWSRLPRDLSPRVRELLQRCLEKDPKKRRRDCGDIRLDLEQAIAEPDFRSVDASALTELRRRSSVRGIVAASATAALLLAVTTAVMLWSARKEAEPVRFTLSTPPISLSPAALAVSPDGRYVAYVVRGPLPTPSLFVRAMDSPEALPLAGTEGAQVPFWSPDGRHIGFAVLGEERMLKRIALAGGPPQTVTRVTNVTSAAWNAEGTIVFSTGDTIRRVPASGGEAEEIAKLDAAAGERIYLLHTFLPDGRRFLYSSPWGKPGVYAQSLDSPERTQVLPFPARTQYAAGFLLFNRDSALFAQRFDADRLALSGEPIPIAADAWFVGMNNQSKFSASAGALVYEILPDIMPELSQLAWYDRRGTRLESIGDPGDYEGVDLSPNDRYIAVHRHEGWQASDRGDIWVVDRVRKTSEKVTREIGHAIQPVWSPDSQQIAFTGRDFNLYRQDAHSSGARDLVFQAGAFGAHTADWHGETVVFADANALSTIPAAGGASTRLSFTGQLGKLSPDGQWIAYTSAESGRTDVYVRAYPNGGQPWRVSTSGGRWPRWSRGGRDLVYLAPDNKLMAVSIATDAAEPVTEPARILFTAEKILSEIHALYEQNYDVSADGEHFLINERVNEVQTTPASPQDSALAVVLNWAEKLQ